MLASCNLLADDRFEQLEKAAIRVSKENFGPAYWLEMTSLVGWERMILVFGYGDNRSACEEIRSHAAATNPDRSYVCTEVTD